MSLPSPDCPTANGLSNTAEDLSQTLDPAPKIQNVQDLKIHAIMMIRNEADIILPALNQAQELFDKLVIVDVQSTDGTAETIRSFGDFWPNIDTYSIDMQEKYQAVMMNELARKSFEAGADWVFLLDADEFINVNGRKELQCYMKDFPYDVMYMPWINLIPINYGQFDRFDMSQKFYWSGRVSLFNKIAISRLYAATNPDFYIHEGNHFVSREFSESAYNANIGLTLLHIPIRSAARLKYKISSMIKLVGSKHNNKTGEGEHVKKIFQLIAEKPTNSEGLNILAANYGVNDDNIFSLNPAELDWPSKRLPNYVVNLKPVSTSTKALGDTLDADSELVWRKPQFIKGSAVRAKIEDKNIRIQPQPITGAGDLVSGQYQKLNIDNPAIPATLDINLLTDSIAVSFLKIRTWTFSAWSELIPSLFCLFNVLRPRRFVELGVHNGMSFFAGCEVAKSLNLDTQCVAIDSWEGDPHAGFHSSEVFDQFRATLKENYPSQHYLQAYFKDALPCFDDESIDLLHIDGYHSYEAIKDDFETWLPKMSQCGVIIFHDINVHEREFGVWRFWEGLKKRYPNFSLLHCHGLGILYVGTQSNSIRDLFSLFADSQSLTILAQQYLTSVGELAVGHRRLLEETRSSNHQLAEREGRIAFLIHQNRQIAEREERIALLTDQLALRRWQDNFARGEFLTRKAGLGSWASSNIGIIHRLLQKRQNKTWYKTIKDFSLFDADYYLSTYEDVRKAGADPILHYVQNGAAELRNPNASFNTAGYLLKNEDVMHAYINPLVHYILYGMKENRTW